MKDKARLVLLFAGIIVAFALNCIIYWNQHLYYSAAAEAENTKKITILERADRVYPYNDLVHYALGEIYFNQGSQRLNEASSSLDDFKAAADHYTRSIQVNPASQFSHFELGRTMTYLDLLSTDESYDYLEQYRKTVDLVGFDSQLYLNVTRLFLARWAQLDDGEREYVSNLFSRLWEENDEAVIQPLLQLWEMEIKEYRMMDSIIPEDKWAYAFFARYLGERSLDLGERLKYLSLHEKMVFQEALDDYTDAENEYFFRRRRSALDKFRSSLRHLERIRFYQDLTTLKPIAVAEYNSLRKNSIFHIIQCLMETGAEKAEIWPYLSQFLVFENNLSVLSDLGQQLMQREYLVADMDRNLNDLSLLSNQLFFHYKQNKFREIVRIGRAFEQSYVVIPEQDKPQFVRILNIIGDAFMSIDNLYGASDFYARAHDVAPENLDTLINMRQNLEKRDEQEAIRTLNAEIEPLLSPPSIPIRGGEIGKGRALRQVFQFDAEDIVLRLSFDGQDFDKALVGILYNGRILWEGFLNTPELSLSLETLPGENEIEIHSISRNLVLKQVDWEKSARQPR